MLARTPARPRPSQPEPDKARKTGLALGIWHAARTLRGSPAEGYLWGRKLRGLPDGVAESLRFHPSCPRGSGPAAERLPALVALLRDVRTDEPCGIRRIFIEPDGNGGWRKASGGSEKMALGRAAGACVKLTRYEHAAHGLFVAEGVETALAAMCKGMAPVWAAGDAGNIRGFPVLPGIGCLTILADRDASGTGVAAALSCAARWDATGRKVRIIPPRRHKDWNDVVRECAA